MKTLISDHDYELHLGGTAKPGIQKTLDCRRGPLIFTLPASSFVVILSFDWLDGTDRAAVPAKTHG
jgi:hypothetical protein